MEDPSKLIYALAALIFGAAVVGLLWGEQLGWYDMARQVPGIVWLGLVIVVFVVGMRFTPNRPVIGGQVSWRAILFAVALVALLAYVLYQLAG